MISDNPVPQDSEEYKAIWGDNHDSDGVDEIRPVARTIERVLPEGQIPHDTTENGKLKSHIFLILSFDKEFESLLTKK